eukprot:NODE_8882_length_1463_cov_3.609281.p1 GENE.NODE_8882_length_1463_cov_3.609281~~NODE_8882_length_1463_cov_3.609281.p1  ORF type:complete len:386 (+),score=53.68 NODE_8882_length_1463_cov_3.609281:115-1272(+)
MAPSSVADDSDCELAAVTTVPARAASECSSDCELAEFYHIPRPPRPASPQPAPPSIGRLSVSGLTLAEHLAHPLAAPVLCGPTEAVVRRLAAKPRPTAPSPAVLEEALRFKAERARANAVGKGGAGVARVSKRAHGEEKRVVGAAQTSRTPEKNTQPTAAASKGAHGEERRVVGAAQTSRTAEKNAQPAAAAHSAGTMCRTQSLLRHRREERESSGTAFVAIPKTEDGTLTTAVQRPCSVLFDKAGLVPHVAAEIQLSNEAGGADRCTCRSLLWNFRRNRELVEDVNCGMVTVGELLKCSHEELAPLELQRKRRRMREEALGRAVLRDVQTFAVTCEDCGSSDARGVMVHFSSGPIDNHRESWGQMAMRGSCCCCGHVWVDGRDP